MSVPTVDATPTAIAPLADWLVLAPETLLAALGFVLLILEVSLLGRSETLRHRVLQTTAMLGMASCVALLLPQVFESLGGSGPEPGRPIFDGTLVDDLLTRLARTGLALLGLVALALVRRDASSGSIAITDALIIWSTVGFQVLVAANELLTLFVALELQALCLYLAAAQRRDCAAAEAGLKFFIYGSVASAVLVFGLGWLYGLTGSTSLTTIAQVLSAGSEPEMATPIIEGVSPSVLGMTSAFALTLILVGFAFKLAVAPFHPWSPDTYAGSASAIGAWLSTGSKLAGLVALGRLTIVGLPNLAGAVGPLFVPGWTGLVAILAAVSMTWGNLVALRQRNLKRLLAYSSIAHIGYLLIGLAATTGSDGTLSTEAFAAVLFYLVPYVSATLVLFAIVNELEASGRDDRIEGLSGLARARPGLGFALTVSLMVLIGLPPTSGFLTKLALFLEPWEVGGALAWLVALALINSVISGYYYVRILRTSFDEPKTDPPDAPALSWSGRAILVLATGLILTSSLVPAPFAETADRAAETLTPSRLGLDSGSDIPDHQDDTATDLEEVGR